MGVRVPCLDFKRKAGGAAIFPAVQAGHACGLPALVAGVSREAAKRWLPAWPDAGLL